MPGILVVALALLSAEAIPLVALAILMTLDSLFGSF